MQKEEFIKFITAIFKSYGFTKKGNNFYYDFQNEFIGVFGLQKSYYGPYYYIEFGFAIKGLNPKMPFPKFDELNLNFGRAMFGDFKAVYYEELNTELFKEKLQEKISFLVETGRSGKEEIREKFLKFGSHVIGQRSAAYLDIPPNSKPCYPGIPGF